MSRPLDLNADPDSVLNHVIVCRAADLNGLRVETLDGSYVTFISDEVLVAGSGSMKERIEFALLGMICRSCGYVLAPDEKVDCMACVSWAMQDLQKLASSLQKDIDNEL